VLSVLLERDEYQEFLQQHARPPLEELLQRWGAMQEHLKGLA
jgi:hypothetical protein